GIDLAGGHVAGLAQVGVDEPLVMAEVEVRLGPVVRDENLAMLVGRHRARVNVDIGIQLLEGDAQAAGLQDGPYGRRRDPLTDRGNHATGYEDVLRHRDSILRRYAVLREPVLAAHNVGSVRLAVLVRARCPSRSNLGEAVYPYGLIGNCETAALVST